MMTRGLFFSLLLQVQVAWGQSTDSISTITFRYEKGHSTFGHSGQYAIGEIIEYSKTGKGDFQLVKYFQQRNFYDSATNSIQIDLSRKKLQAKPVSKRKFDKLLVELNTCRNNFSPGYVRQYLKKPSMDDILAIADKYDLKNEFEGKYADKESQNKIFREMRSFRQLDKFLMMKKPDTANELVVTDVWDMLHITCRKGADTVDYRIRFFELFGQPVKKYTNENLEPGKKVVNLNINNSIKQILPKSSLIRWTVDLNAIIEEYIKWYLEKLVR